MSVQIWEECFRDRLSRAEKDGNAEVATAYRSLLRTLKGVSDDDWNRLDAAYRAGHRRDGSKEAVEIETAHLADVGDSYTPKDAAEFIRDLTNKLEPAYFM